LADKNGILCARSSGKAFFTPDTPTLIERMILLSDSRSSEDPFFVMGYRSRQYANGKQVRGSRALYEVVNFIGAGQSAETYKAKVTSLLSKDDDLRVGDNVVIKVPLFDPCLRFEELIELSTNLASLFVREEASLLRLTSLDCVASFVDTGSHRFPRPSVPEARLIVQKYVEGKPLDEHLRTNFSDPHSGKFVGLNAHMFYKLGRALAESVRKAHSKLVVHGDIWPENILISSNGDPILIDFGQAVFREAIGASREIPGRNSRYIAPEKIRSVGGDVYSLGGVLHYIATGEDPLQELPSDIDILKSKTAETIKRTNDALYTENRGAVDIIAHCLRTSDQRTAHAHGVVEELDTFFGKHDRGTVEDALRSVQTEAKRVDNGGHELFRWMASLRVNALRATLSDMSGGVYDLVGDHEVIVSGLTQYLGLLGDGDKYLTVSVPNFWYARNLGLNGRFLSMNTLASQRGAIVKRLFVVTETDRRNPEFQPMITAQKMVLDETSALALKGRYEVKILDVTESERKDLVKKSHHFGLMARGDGEVAIFPEYRVDGSLAAVRFRAGSDLVGGLREIFEDYWHKAKELTSV
jgi:serine/threonine protein kinase